MSKPPKFKLKNVKAIMKRIAAKEKKPLKTSLRRPRRF